MLAGLRMPTWDRTLWLALVLVPAEIRITLRTRKSLRDPVKRAKIRERFEGVSHWMPLWEVLPGMLLHALVDVRSGRVLRAAFTDPTPNAPSAP